MEVSEPMAECACGLVDPGPEHKANKPLLCREHPPAAPTPDPRAVAYARLDEALFACVDAGISLADLLAHIAGHEISEDN